MADQDVPVATSEGLHIAPAHDLAATRSLLAAGASIAELQRLQYSASELKEAGCSAKDLCPTYSYQDIKAAGFEPLVLLDCGWTGNHFFLAGFNLLDLKNAGFSAEQCRSLFSQNDLLNMGISQLDIKWLLEGGFHAGELQRLNFDAMMLKNAGCPAYQLRGVFSVYELKQAGIGAAWLLANGWTADELASRVDDLAIFSISEMREAGAHANSLAQIGYTLQDLRACGYDTLQLSEAGVAAYTDCSTRDCCINVFECVGCDQIPHDTLPIDAQRYIPCSEYICIPCQCVIFLLSGRSSFTLYDLRMFNWFFHPFEAFLGMRSCCNLRIVPALKSQGCLIELLFFFSLVVGFAYSLVCSTVSLFACLPCFICFNLSRCVRQLKQSKFCGVEKRLGYPRVPPRPFVDALFWIIYTPLLFMSLSGRWVWKTLCCGRSCFGFARGACGPNCTSKHENSTDGFAVSVCMLCGRPANRHTDDFHTCMDGRRGSFLWTGPEYDVEVEQKASTV